MDLGTDLGRLCAESRKEGRSMRKKGFKGRCEKRKLGKSKEVCRTYDTIQYAYADILQARKDVAEIRCNVPLDGCDYTTDFLCIKTNNDLMIRECVQRKYLTKPMTIKLLDLSREYWLKRGISDWGLVIDADEK